MTRSNITALLMATVVTCTFANAQVEQVVQTDRVAGRIEGDNWATASKKWLPVC